MAGPLLFAILVSTFPCLDETFDFKTNPSTEPGTLHCTKILAKCISDEEVARTVDAALGASCWKSLLFWPPWFLERRAWHPPPLGGKTSLQQEWIQGDNGAKLSRFWRKIILNLEFYTQVNSWFKCESKIKTLAEM